VIETFFESLLLVLQWKAFAFMLLGVALGFWVGLLPGLGGATTLALMLPFISTTLYVLKLRVMKLLFRVLYAEARRRGKPIVYLAHPEEFGPQTWTRFKASDWSLRRLRTHGLMLRQRLNESNPETRLKLNRELFEYMAALPGVRFMTMRDYARQTQHALNAAAI